MNLVNSVLQKIKAGNGLSILGHFSRSFDESHKKK